MKRNDYNRIIKLLQDLGTKYPEHNMGKHLDYLFSEYKNLWGVQDRDIANTLDRYKASLDLNTVPDKSIEEILTEGQHLDTLFTTEEDE